MLKRFVFVALALITAAAAVAADSTLKDRLMSGWDGINGVYLPNVTDKIRGMGLDPQHDYTEEATRFLEGNPDAPYLCAALTLTPQPPRWTGQGQDLRNKETELCKKHTPTAAQIAQVRAILYPPPPPRRQQIQQQLVWSPEINSRKWGSVYYPPPLSPKDWQNGNSAGHDYRSELQAEFDRDPLLVVRVCNFTKTHTPDPDPRIEQFRKTYDEVCSAFPDAKIETAFRAYRAAEGKAWLTGLLNNSLDEAATLTPDLRAQKEASLLEELPRMPASGTARLENAIRAVALSPGDWRAVAEVLKHAPEGSWKSPGGAETADVLSWMSDTYAQRSAAGRNQSEWRRGQRALLVMTGELEKARAVAEQIASENDVEKHSLDQIYLAAIKLALGDASAYQKLMIDCPAPDALYVRDHGDPSRAERYCEDVLAEFARTAREQLRGNPAQEAFAQIARETNHVAPAAVTTLAAPPRVVQSPESETDDWFSATVKAEEERVAKMTKVQRETEGAKNFPTLGKSVGFERAVYNQLLRPWHEGNAANLLAASLSFGYSPQFDKREQVAKLVSEWLEKRATSGPEANEWKRGLRAYVLFRGDFTRARDLGRQLDSDPKFALHDSILFGLTERVFGNRKPLDDAIATCPGLSKEQLDDIGESSQQRRDYCQSLVQIDIARAIIISHSKQPNAYKEILREGGADKKSPTDVRADAITWLQWLDPDLAEMQWKDLLVDPKCVECAAEKAYIHLARIAEQKKQWKDGIFWVDRYINELGFARSYRPEMWKWFADLPEGTWGSRNLLTEAYELRLRLALGAGDYETAKRGVENMLGFAEDCRCGVTPVRLALTQIAADEISHGKRQEPLRILGYLSRQPLSAYFIARVDDLRKKIGAEPKSEDSPWDSPARPSPPRTPLKPQPQAVPTSLSKT